LLTSGVGFNWDEAFCTVLPAKKTIIALQRSETLWWDVPRRSSILHTIDPMFYAVISKKSLAYMTYLLCVEITADDSLIVRVELC